jgi:glyoxylase-like metal-dependent hydrolase (beta-lactamase superfamily II)
MQVQPAPFEPGPITCHVLDTGHCLASEHHLIRGGRWRRVACHSIAALLHHPRQGWWLWDAGYAPRMLEATRRMPYRLYRWATPLRLDPSLAVTAQLPRYGLTASDIRRVVVSHFHADHIAGLLDFPQAEWLALKSAHDGVVGRVGFRALARAFIPSLLPDDFHRRASLLPDFTGPMFEDGSALLVALPGHARGQIGLFVRTQRGPIFFAADSCWMSASYRERRPPHFMTNFFVDDAKAVAQTIDHLHTFALDRPEVAIIPSHCPEAFAIHAEFSGRA